MDCGFALGSAPVLASVADTEFVFGADDAESETDCPLSTITVIWFLIWKDCEKKAPIIDAINKQFITGSLSCGTSTFQGIITDCSG
jgi:hypothetical protein